MLMGMATATEEKTRDAAVLTRGRKSIQSGRKTYVAGFPLVREQLGDKLALQIH